MSVTVGEHNRLWGTEEAAFIDEVPQSDVPSVDHLVSWLSSPVESPLDEETCHTSYLMMSPAVRFVKNLAPKSVVFEADCAGGSLAVFRDWLGFQRKDLTFLGASSEKKVNLPATAEMFVGDLDLDKPKFVQTPTAAVLRRLVERLRRPELFFVWLSKVMPTGGQVYIEWPSAHTIDLPPASAVRERGYDVSTINFHDDARQLTAFSIEQMIAMARRAGFRVYTAGHVDMPLLADSLKHHGITLKNSYYLAAAIHLRTAYSSFIIATKR
jgi:hypothetical protein